MLGSELSHVHLECLCPKDLQSSVPMTSGLANQTQFVMNLPVSKLYLYPVKRSKPYPNRSPNQGPKRLWIDFSQFDSQECLENGRRVPHDLHQVCLSIIILIPQWIHYDDPTR